MPSSVGPRQLCARTAAQEIDEALRKATEIAAAAERKSRIPIPLSIKRLQQGTERSEAVIAGSMVFVSAQTASLPGEAEGGASGNAEEQTASALGKVQILLEEAGSSQTKIVTAVLYVRDFEDMSAVHAAWRRWTGDDNMPATTVVQAGVEKEDSGLRVAVQVTAHL